jgi:hypothetical protein
MAVSETSEDYALPCGQRLEALWESLDAGTAGPPGRHEQDCPHCQTALSGLVALRDATREMAAAPAGAPPRLTGRIMAAVRADKRRARMLPLAGAELEPGGQAEISEQAVAVVLRFAADSVGGVRARRCTVRPSDPGEAPDGESGWVDVELTLVLRYGPSPGGQPLAAVRQAVLAAAEDRIGLRVARCDLFAEDLWPEPADGEA